MDKIKDDKYMDAIILAGGQGKRLRPLTNGIPKCMAPINGRPMLQYNIDNLRKYPSVGKIIIACGYKWEEIKKHYKNSLFYSVEKEPLGTSGAIKNAIQMIEGDEFFIVNADDITNVDFDKLAKMGSNATVVSMLRSPFGVVEIKDDKILKFREKPILPHYVNIGVHVLNKDINFVSKGSLESDVLPKVAEKNMLKAFKHNGLWVTVNTMKDLEEAVTAVKGFF